MYYEGVSDELPVEAIVARSLGDEDWADLCTDPRLNDGGSRAAPHLGDRDEGSRYEAEPVTIKDLTVTRRRVLR